MMFLRRAIPGLLRWTMDPGMQIRLTSKGSEVIMGEAFSYACD